MTIAPSGLTQLNQHRQQFPALRNKAYFNYGGQGPMPQEAIAALSQSQDYIQSAGPFSDAVNQWIGQEMQQTRAAIAAELQVAPQTITLTENVSAGCNIPLWGLSWRAGDHILMSDCEHPGIIAAIQELQRRFGLEVSVCPLMATLNSGNPVEAIAAHLRPTTRLLVISHVLWNTGQVLPLSDIVALCHAQPDPVAVLVDAAQSVGVLPLHLSDIGADFYAFTGHKWWCGPAGVGGLYVHPEAVQPLQPTFIGWRGITKTAQGFPTGWVADGRRFEVATSDYPLYASLRTAIACHATWGDAQQRFQRIQMLSKYLWQRLQDMPQITCLRSTPPEAGLVSFQLTGVDLDHARFVQTLEQDGFLLRTILDPDCVRACVHYLTLETEIDALLERIEQILRSP